MTQSEIKNLATSVKARLANLARDQKEDFQELLSRYGRERLLYRLSVSKYRDRFVLKGALLFAYWMGTLHRPTRDMDLLGFGASDITSVEEVFFDLCTAQVVPDGMVFQRDSVKGERIKDEEEYEGVRIHMTALLEKTRVPLQIDVAFGDRIVPGPEEIDFPTLLEFPAPHLKSYTRESMVAEKFEAMVKLGILNTRMKDFFDVWSASRQFKFAGSILSEAIKATFGTRDTVVPNKPPTALTSEFYDDSGKKAQWTAFLSKSKLNADGRSLPEVAEALRSFLMPVSVAVANGETYKETWRPGGPWVNFR
ncbi:MAG TPA: nucleotidyl transferase AbiEii/AbiGii toxin family protein [Anaerolineales bacterium]|nr:nucleotidyl transferase AbiEii/AbiGii toxin family protein [Anaerolineales bacterium]